jgi:hypothetical protein
MRGRAARRARNALIRGRLQAKYEQALEEHYRWVIGLGYTPADPQYQPYYRWYNRRHYLRNEGQDRLNRTQTDEYDQESRTFSYRRRLAAAKAHYREWKRGLLD